MQNAILYKFHLLDRVLLHFLDVVTMSMVIPAHNNSHNDDESGMNEFAETAWLALPHAPS